MSTEDRLLPALLRGESGPWPTEEGLADHLLAASRRHGVQLLLHERIRRTPLPTDWPRVLGERLGAVAVEEAARDLLRTRELGRLLGALAEAGIRPLVMKGAALAHQLYPAPALRTRQDADLLVREADLPGSMRVLTACGYQPEEKDLTVRGEPGSAHYQRSFTARDRHGLHHAIDLHWRASDTPLFTHLLELDELAADAVPIPALGPHARGLGLVHALLLACLHRVHHAQEPDRGPGVPYYGSDRLIWLYDIHLLCGALGPSQWAAFETLSRQKRLGAVCRDGLRAAREALGTPLPEPALAILSAPAAADEIPLAWLAGSHGRRWLTDLWGLPSWGLRLTLLRETLFPPTAYMLERYGTRCRWLLPLLYAHRALAGVWKYRR